MGARSAQPCASRFCAGPTPIRFKHCLRLLLPPGSRKKKDQTQTQIQRQKPKPQCPLLLLLQSWGLMRPRPQETVEGRPGGLRRTVGAMGPRHASGGLGRTPNPGLAGCAGQRTRARRHRAPRGEGALVAKHCFASARTHSRQRLGRTPEGGLRRVLSSPPGRPHTHQSRRQTPQPRALLGFTRFPKKIALISSRSVPCQYLRCAGSSANSTTLPCPCADTSSHALPATRVRLRSDR